MASSCGRSRTSMRWRRGGSSRAPADPLPGIAGSGPRPGGHPPGHSVVPLTSGGEQLTFAGDLVFTVGFEHPEWFNGFEHDPEEASRVRIDLLRELAAAGGMLVATHMPFPSIGHVAVAGDAFRWVPAIWDY